MSGRPWLIMEGDISGWDGALQCLDGKKPRRGASGPPPSASTGLIRAFFVDNTRINGEVACPMTATSIRPNSSAGAVSPLRDEVRAGAEDRPGVYRWLGAGGRILYVGKSVRVRTRLLSYFREETGKAARMVAEAEAVRWDYSPNEFAALVREMRLIRAWQPEYNVQHKRDRRFGFIKVTREPAPRLVPVSRPVSDGAQVLWAVLADGLDGARGARTGAGDRAARLFSGHPRPLRGPAGDVPGEPDAALPAGRDRDLPWRPVRAAARWPPTTIGCGRRWRSWSREAVRR